MQPLAAALRLTAEGTLASGRLDLALDTPELSSADLEHERIREEPFVLVMREGHPNAGAKLTLEVFLFSLAPRHHS